MKKITCITLVLSAACVISYAQDRIISGTVKSAESGETLPGATVVIKQTTLGTVTDENGKYELVVPDSARKIMFSYIGFAPVIRQISADASDKITFDVEMNPSGVSLEQVVVSVSKRKEKILEAPASIAILESEAIEQNIAATPSDHLNNISGLDVSRTGLVSSNVVARGFNNVFSGTLLTLVDNRIAAVPSLRINAYQMIPGSMYDYDRIEVVKGLGVSSLRTQQFSRCAALHNQIPIGQGR